MSNPKMNGVSAAILAAALFGASTPFSKLLLGNVSPILLAGLLYLGSGAGLSLLFAARRLRRDGAMAQPRCRWCARIGHGWPERLCPAPSSARCC